LLVLKLTMWIEGIFGPIYIGALIFALARIKKGWRCPTPRPSAPVSATGRAFPRALVAGILVLAGLIALVVPGVMLIVRYALLEPAVVLENAERAGRAGAAHSSPREALADLRRGPRVLRRLHAALVCRLHAAGFFDSPRLMPVEVVLDCLLDVAYTVVQITMFLFYWEASGAGARPCRLFAALRAESRRV